MAKTLIAADLDLALDVLRRLTTQVALDAVVAVDKVPDRNDLGVGEVAHLGVVRDLGRVQHLLGPRPTDPMDIGQADLDPLFAWEVNS